MEVKWIDITLLRPNNYNPNRLSPEEFKDLVIQNAGYCEQNPILTRPLDGYFEIVDGEHRWKACLELKIEKIPAIVRQMDDLEAHRLCVILNKDRGTPDYFKLSKLFNEDLEGGLQQKDLAGHFGFAKSSISEIVKIYPRLKNMIDKFDMSNFSNRDLLVLARVEGDYLRQELVKRAREGNWSSNKIQDKASLCNKALSYLKNKTEDEKLTAQILGELVDSVFTYPESTLLNEIELKFCKI